MTRFFYVSSWVMGLSCMAVAFVPPLNDKSVICFLVGAFIIATNRKANDLA
jgi:hypothetical protein